MRMRFIDHFDRIFIISLPSKADRRERLEKNLQEAGLAQPDELSWVKAVSGNSCPPPAYFKAGSGAWGCLQSHLRVIQDAIMDGIESFVALEDDVFFHPEAAECLTRLMAEVPPDWDQIYLGGQHLKDPEPVEGSPFVFRCHNVNRTHAFALRRKVFPAFQQHIANAPDYIDHPTWHIDHQLGLAHERKAWATYAPIWWLAGQDHGSSNISGRVTPRHWWHPQVYSEGLPFVVFPPQPMTGKWEGLMKNCHFGNSLKPGTVEDVGIDECVGSPEKLTEFLKMIAIEAIDLWKLPAISHPAIGANEVTSIWKAGTRHFNPTELPVLLNYPFNGLFPHPLNRV